jgi:hypothetical protein
MGEAERIESQVKNLSPDELAKFRDWFFEFDADVWDRKLQADSESGKLDKLLTEARSEFSAGQVREI